MKKTAPVSKKLNNRLNKVRTEAIAAITDILGEIGEYNIGCQLTSEPEKTIEDIYKLQEDGRVYVTLVDCMGTAFTKPIEDDCFIVEELVSFASELEHAIND
jgi:hypothetical protein